MPSDFPTSFDKDGLLKCARGELFGQGNAQLPEPPMLMMDRVTEISSDGGLHGKGHVIAQFDIHPELWFFKCHFPGDPVMPGCLGLDALWQLTGFNLGTCQPLLALRILAFKLGPPQIIKRGLCFRNVQKFKIFKVWIHS